MITITIPRLGPPRFRVRDDQDVPTSAHIIMVSPLLEVLLLRRTGDDFGGHWGMPGGSIEPGEAVLPALLRELVEEIGVDLKSIPHAINRLQEGPVMGGSQCFILATHRFVPVLNDEHDAATWAPITDLPSPMHPNARAVIRHFHQNFRGFNHG